MHAYKILDSRGNWTVAVDINGAVGVAPSGASTGAYEAKVIDADKAVQLVNRNLQHLVGKNLAQDKIDSELEKIDGTPDFSKIGGNTAIAVSFAVYNFLSQENKRKKQNIFPHPLGNVLGGGAHGGFTAFQEFLVIPSKVKTITDAVSMNEEFYHALKSLIEKKITKGRPVGMNDEGALVADIDDIKALEMLSEIRDSIDCRIGLDIAASQFFDGKAYSYKSLKMKLKPEEHIDFIIDLAKKYKLYYIEDPVNENDIDGFAEITKKIGKKCLVCGDDFFVTSRKRLENGIKNKAANAIIIKPNQAGTVSRALETTNLAKKRGYMPVISHRSAETADSTISRIAVDWKIPIIKAGVADIRVAKLDALIALWDAAEKPKMAYIPR